MILPMNRYAIFAELLEIEGMLQDDRLNDGDRQALHRAQQALLNVLDRETWHRRPRRSTRSTSDQAKQSHCFCIDRVWRPSRRSDFDYDRYKRLLSEAIDEPKRPALIDLLVEERAKDRGRDHR